MAENMTKLDMEELDDVAGGASKTEKSKNLRVVSNGAGANIRAAKSETSAKKGHLPKGAFISDAQDAGPGKEGYAWLKIKAQGGVPGGYIAKHLTKKV